MNIGYDISLDDLRRLSDYIQQVVLLTKPAIARGLNGFGEIVLQSFLVDAETQTGLDPGDLRQHVTVYPADADNLEWRLDATALTPSPNWQPDMESFVTGPGIYNADTLLKIVTDYADVCDICEQAIEEGPYSADEINQLAAKWANYTPPHPLEGYRTNLIHPNCRCRPEPWSGSKRVFIVRGPAQGETVTGKGLGALIGNELTVSIKDIK